MIHPARHRIATILLSAAYALASVMGGLPHDHGHAAAEGGHDHASHAGGGHCSSHEHESDVVATLGSTTPEGAAHDDDCTLCRAAGQRVLVVGPAQLGHLSEMCVELVILAPAQPSAAFARTQHSRAPPAVG